MKKFYFILSLMLAIVGIMATGCSSCESGNKKQEVVKESVYHDYNGVVQDFTAGVNHIQALHRQEMFRVIEALPEDAKPLNPDGYEWRNCRVMFNDTLTLENIDELHIMSIKDVYCYWNKFGPWKQDVISHVELGVLVPWPENDLWIEDGDMSNAPIKLTFEDALQRLKEYNGIIPRSYFITLRLPVGPKKCNPQWTFGGIEHVLFIDAVTGEISDNCPAF